MAKRRTKSRRRRKRRKQQRRRRTRRRHSKKGGQPIDIHPGDILVMNFGGATPFTSYKHVALAIDGLMVSDDRRRAFLPLAHCGGRGCILSGLEYIPNKNNKTIWVLRYKGPHTEELRNYAAFIAETWAKSEKLQFSKCRSVRALLPCFWKKADRKTGKKYIRDRVYPSTNLPKYDNEKYIGMFCSKFGLAVWMAAIGSFYDTDQLNWKALDKCLPLKPSNCAPWDLIALPKKIPDCWKKVGEFKGWGQWMDIGIEPEAGAEEFIKSAI
jgi:hypothetical protein